MSSLRDSIQAYVTSGTVPEWATMLRRLRTEHRTIFDAVLAGEPALASRRVAAHIEGFYRSTLA